MRISPRIKMVAKVGDKDVKLYTSTKFLNKKLGFENTLLTFIEKEQWEIFLFSYLNFNLFSVTSVKASTYVL